MDIQYELAEKTAKFIGENYRVKTKAYKVSTGNKGQRGFFKVFPCDCAFSIFSIDEKFCTELFPSTNSRRFLPKDQLSWIFKDFLQGLTIDSRIKNRAFFKEFFLRTTVSSRITQRGFFK